MKVFTLLLFSPSLFLFHNMCIHQISFLYSVFFFDSDYKDVVLAKYREHEKKGESV